MTFVHGVDVEKPNQQRILVNHARVSGAGSDGTEHAGGAAQVIHLRTNPPTPPPLWIPDSNHPARAIGAALLGFRALPHEINARDLGYAGRCQDTGTAR